MKVCFLSDLAWSMVFCVVFTLGLRVSEWHLSGSSLKIMAKRKKEVWNALLKHPPGKKKVTSTHILLTTSNHVVMPKYKRVVRYSCLICSAEPELFGGEYCTIIVIWCEQMIHWKSPWCWERLKAGGEGVRGWDGWTASLLQWTWVWANSRRWWGTGRPWHAFINGITKSPTRLGNWKQQYN